jgi:hypothetical protein
MYHLEIRDLLVFLEAMLDYVLVNMHTENYGQRLQNGFFLNNNITKIEILFIIDCLWSQKTYLIDKSVIEFHIIYICILYNYFTVITVHFA